MTSHTGTTEADDEAMFLLNKVKRHSFAANPAAIGPFGPSLLSWSVTAPEGVTIRLDGLTVEASGERWLLPAATETHRLSAKAGSISKSLGVASVHVNDLQCRTLDDALLPTFLAVGIQKGIEEDDSGVYFRMIPGLDPAGGFLRYVRSKPSVSISTDRLTIALQLGKVVNNFPDASIDLSISFGLQVVQDSFSIIGHRRIAATAEVITVDISFPFYAWLIPGAMIGLPIAIDGGKEEARARSMKMINQIVGQTGLGIAIDETGHAIEEKSLNNYFQNPAGMEKHDVQLYVNSVGQGIFAVQYCPNSGPVVIS
jgi:hypothetical protein